MTDKRLEQRMEQQIEQSTDRALYKRWYRRPWGRLVLILIVLAMAGLSYYLYLTAKYVQEIRNFDVNKTLESFRSDKNFNTLITADDPGRGNPEANIVIVAFEDFQCPFCLQAKPIMDQVMAKYGDRINFIYRDFPLSSIHPQAQSAAEAANCALEQDTFWEYHDQLFARQEELSPVTYRKIAESLGLDMAKFNICFNTGKYKAEVLADYDDGVALGVVGTPTYFINGQIFPGVLKMDFWDKVIALFTTN